MLFIFAALQTLLFPAVILWLFFLVVRAIYEWERKLRAEGADMIGDERPGWRSAIVSAGTLQ